VSEDPRSYLEFLPAALNALRESQGLSNAEAVAKAREAGCRINPGMLSRWQNGRQTPTLEALIAYLAALGRNLYDLHRAIEEAGTEPLEYVAGPGALPDLDDEVREYAERTDLDDLRVKVRRMEAAIRRLTKKSAG